MAVLFWGLLAVGLGLTVVFSSQLEFLVPALAALAALGVASIPGQSENWTIQTVVWLSVSIAGLLMFRKRLRELRWGSHKKAEDSVAGRVVQVIEDIPEGGEGRVRFLGTTWKARSIDPLATGTEAVILAQEGIVLHVAPFVPDQLAAQMHELEVQQKKKEGE